MTTAAKPKKNKYRSGFCNDINKMSQHEGTKPVSSSGAPMPVCLDWQHCPCRCHEEITRMYETLGMEREDPEQNADYLAAVHSTEVQTRLMLDEVYATAARSRSLSMPGGTVAPRDDEGPSTGTPDPVHGTSAAPAAAPRPSFAPTPTGRRARGQLEYDVLQICDEFSRNVYDWEACTPKLVAERIGKLNDTEPPSTGAINAVWDRWEKLGFAEQAKKPSRFVRFTGASGAHDLDRLKSQSKFTKKRTQAEMKRGTLRPRGR